MKPILSLLLIFGNLFFAFPAAMAYPEPSSFDSKSAVLTYLRKLSQQAITQLLNLEVKATETTLQFLDEDQNPIPQAKVFLGLAPQASQAMITDAEGKVTFEVNFTETQTISVAAPQFVFSTFLNQKLAPTEIRAFSLKQAPAPVVYELSGQATGFQVVDQDGWADFGVTFPILKAEDLTYFQLNRVISFERDQTSAAGRTLYIPANISLPHQSEDYSIVTVTLDKVSYKNQFDQPGPHNVYSVYGRFPFKRVIDEFRAGKDFAELLNYFTYYTGTVSKVDLKQPKTVMNLPVNKFGFKTTKSFVTPNIPPGFTLFGNSLSSQADGEFYISDIKKLASKFNQPLVVHDAKNPYLQLTLKDEKKVTPGPGNMILSTALVPFTGATPELLPVLSPLQFDAQKLIVKIPQALPVNKNLVPLGSVVKLSNVVYFKNSKGEIKGEKSSPVWDVYSNDWSQNFELPKFSFANIQALRVTASFLAAPQATAFILGPEMIKKSTHATTTSNPL